MHFHSTLSRSKDIWLMRHKLSVTALHTRGKQNIKEPEGSREGGALGPRGGRKEAPLLASCWKEPGGILKPLALGCVI